MMRGPSNWAVAVRKPNGAIAQVCRPIESLMARHRLLRLPVIRGVMALGESLAIGFRALAISANYASQDATAEEFESYELNREKVVPPKGQVTIFVGPLEPGRYPFFGDFHKETAKGVLIAK